MRQYGYEYYAKAENIVKFLNTNQDITVVSITYNTYERFYYIFYYKTIPINNSLSK